MGIARRVCALGLLAALGLGSMPASVMAADPGGIGLLTGHWLGKWKCTVFNGTVVKSKNPVSSVRIRHISEEALMMDVDFTLVRGFLIPSERKVTKGELTYLRCSTDNSFATFGDELGRFKYSVRDAKGAISGTTFLTDGGGTVATCKYSYTRIDTLPVFIALTCP